MTLEVSDGTLTTTCNTSVTIVDTIAPELTLSISPTQLWPPNHKLADINASIVASDVCDPNPIVQLDAVTSNEPDDATGDGHTRNDIQRAAFGTDDRGFQVRAERNGDGSGRVYTATYTAMDGSGNTARRQAAVTVAENLSGH